MSTQSKTLAKSLHTVSAIVAVAKQGPFRFDHVAYCRHTRNVDWALRILGYSDASDPYGLAARAVAILSKDSQS